MVGFTIEEEASPSSSEYPAVVLTASANCFTREISAGTRPLRATQQKRLLRPATKVQARAVGLLTVCRTVVLPAPSKTRSDSPEEEKSDEESQAVCKSQRAEMWHRCSGGFFTGSEMWSGSPTCVVRCKPIGTVSPSVSPSKHVVQHRRSERDLGARSACRTRQCRELLMFANPRTFAKPVHVCLLPLMQAGNSVGC